MGKTEAVAEVFLTAIRSLPKAERDRVLRGLVKDRSPSFPWLPELRDRRKIVEISKSDPVSTTFGVHELDPVISDSS